MCSKPAPTLISSRKVAQALISSRALVRLTTEEYSISGVCMLQSKSTQWQNGICFYARAKAIYVCERGRASDCVWQLPFGRNRCFSRTSFPVEGTVKGADARSMRTLNLWPDVDPQTGMPTSCAEHSSPFTKVITLQDENTLEKREHHGGTSIVLVKNGFFSAKVLIHFIWWRLILWNMAVFWLLFSRTFFKPLVVKNA